MKIVFVTTGFDQVNNGPGVYSQNLWRFFADDPEIDFHIVAVRSQLRHDNLHTLGYKPKGFGSATYAAVNDLASKVLRKLGKDTILHANMAHIITPGLARTYRSAAQVNDTEVCIWKPNIKNLHRHGLRRNVALCWRRRREAAVVKAANMTVCNSAYTLNTVCNAYHLPESRARLIYKAVALKPFEDAAKHVKQSDLRQGTKITFVGSNWHRKGLDTLLKAIALLPDTAHGVHLSVYGEPSSAMRSQFKALSDELGISDRVTFAGHIARDELPRVLASSSMLVLPSYEEALGLVAIESLAAGIPVVGSNVGGLPEVVSNTSCGLLVPPGDPGQLADAIKQVAAAQRDADTQSDRQRAVSHFNVTRLEVEIRKLYANLGEHQITR